MRLVAGVLSLALFAPFAHAEDTATPPGPPAPVPAPPMSNDGARARVPFRVVRVMPETRQALLFDRSRNTHVLAEVGAKLDGYTIEDIDDETVRLRRDNQEVVLAAPLHGADRRRDREPAYVRSASVAASVAAPGTAAGAPAPPAPIDPYGDPPRRPADGPTAHDPAPPTPGDALPAEPGIRVAHAPGTLASPATSPVVPGEGGVRVAVAPDVGPAVGPAPGISAAPSSTGPAVSAAPTAAGPAAIRVVSATPSAAPAASSAPPAASGAGGPGDPDRLSGEIAEPITTPRRGPVAAVEPAPGPKPAEVRAADDARAPNKQTADARALADIMTADRPTRSPRAPAELPGAPTRAAEVRPAAAAPPPPPPGDAGALSRGELDSALADFARLAAGVHGSFSPAGVVIDGVGDGTIFQRAGLRAGDVVTSVDGVRLRTLDDAANLYARASAARAITAQILRAGKPVTLHVVIQ